MLLAPRPALAESHDGGFTDPTPDYPADPGPSAPILEGDYRICPQMDHPSCSHPSLDALAAKVDLGDHEGEITIVLAPGWHADAWLGNARRVTLLGEPGAWFGVPEGRQLTRGAAISLGSLVDGWADQVTIGPGIHFQNHRRGVESDFGTVNLSVVGNSFANNGMHIQAHSAENNPDNTAGSGVISIRDNLFFGTGLDGEYSHGLYLSGNLGGRCEIVGNLMLRVDSFGHGLKLGCSSGLVAGNQVLMLDGEGLPLLDIINGGDWLIRDNVFQAGPRRDSAHLAALAVSKRRSRDQAGGVWEPAAHVTRFHDNTWIVDGGAAISCVVKSFSPGPVEFRGERLVGLAGGCAGRPDLLGTSNPWRDPRTTAPPEGSLAGPMGGHANARDVQVFADRAAAGLPAYDDQLRALGFR